MDLIAKFSLNDQYLKYNDSLDLRNSMVMGLIFF